MKKTISMLFALLMLLCMMTGAMADAAMTDGVYTASAQGFGGTVEVTLTVEGGAIAAAKITGDGETEGIGKAAIPQLEEAIVAAQSADVDAIVGATVTSGAVVAAAAEAVNAATGAEAAELKIADGVYTASAWGFATNRQVNVTVTIEGGKMTAIDVDKAGETEIIINTAIENMVPKMIEYQSVKVDSTTGATVSSGAIKTAVEDCLAQAIAAAEGDKSAISAFYVPETKVEASETIDTDILVVGMGGAGMMAANRAVEAIYAANGGDASKVNVLSIDKAAKFGGTSVTTTSPMSINPASFVAANGGNNYVDVDVLKADWMNYTEGDAKEWAIDVMMNSSGAAVDYLLERGFVFGAPAQGLSAPYLLCCNYGDTFAISKSVVQTYFDAFCENYTSKGGKYMLQTEATDLIMTDGVVTGVKAKAADGTDYTINAKYVILATGGFAGNGEMEDKYLSNEYYNLAGGGRWNVFGMTQNDGKMIQAAIDNGAATYNIGMPPVSHIGGAYKIMHEFPVIEMEYPDIWTGMNATTSLNDVPMMMAVAPNSLAVNRQGVRFQDETTLAAYGNWSAGAYFFTIWSDEQLKNIQDNGLAFDTLGIFINQGGWPSHTPIPEIYDIMEAGIRMGYIYKADSIEALAAEIGVDAATLAKTVADYNAYCETKENPADGVEKCPVIYDLSGRPMEGDYNVYEKVEGNGPYYAVKGAPWIYSTTAALDVNEQFQVLATDGAAIEGLYAVGTDCLGILFTEKREYVTYGGADQGWAFTSGYLAGDMIANDLLSK